MRFGDVWCEPGFWRGAAIRLWPCLACAALLLLLTGSMWALAQPSCGKDPRVQRLTQEGDDTHRPFEERKRDYADALRLCPQSVVAYDGLAALLLQRQDFEGALQWIQRGLIAVPNDPALSVKLALAELSAGRPQAALQALTYLRSTAPIEFYRGLAFRALRDDRAAQKSFSTAVAMGYEDPYVLYMLIEQDRILKDREAGLQHFNLLSERSPDSPWLHVLLGNAYASRHDNENAEEEYNRALERDPNLPMVHYVLGRLAFDRSDYATAEEDLRRETELDPVFGESYLYLGVTLRREGKSAQALPILERATERDPNSALAYTQLAALQIQLQKLGDALRTLHAAKEHFPDEAAFPAQLSQLLYRLGRKQEAQKESELAEALSKKGNHQDQDASDRGEIAATGAGMVSSPLSSSSVGGRAEHPTVEEPLDAGRDNSRLDTLRNCLARFDKKCAVESFAELQDSKLKDDPDYLDLSAQVMSLEHKYSEALEAIDRAIQMEPHVATHRMTKGQIYQRSHDQVHAIQAFLDAEQLKPGWVEPTYSLGMSFFMLGNEDNDTENYDRGARHFRVALELDSNCHKAEFMLGVIDAMKNRLDSAKEHVEKALKMSPQNPNYLFHFGILLKQMGDRDGAIREIELAETLDHSNPLIYYNLGIMESEDGKYAEARKHLETAIQLDSNLAPAYYSLGGVYRRLGLAEKSQAALLKFQQTKAIEQKEEADPLAAALPFSDTTISK